MRKASIRMSLAVIAALALLQGPTGAIAGPSTSHVVTQVGAMATGPYIVSNLTASEATQTGSVVINGNTITISCVSVIPSGPGLHLAGMNGVDASGVAWFILVRQPTPATGLVLVSNTPTTSPWCAAGDWPFTSPPGTGIFLINP